MSRKAGFHDSPSRTKRHAARHFQPAPHSLKSCARLTPTGARPTIFRSGQIYLYANPLLREPLKIEHIKPRLLGTFRDNAWAELHLRPFQSPDQKYDLNVIYLAGPGHGGPGMVANTYLEGTYSEFYPNITPNEEGIQKLFKQFSFPGGIPSHAAPETPGSIHEGGELGYSIMHACGAVFDNPDLLACCVVGDGEAETGPLATSWHGNKFLNPVRDGAVLPILHLNGYKIANPTVLARMNDRGTHPSLHRLWLEALFRRGTRARSDASTHGRNFGHYRERNSIDSRQSSQGEFGCGDSTLPAWPMIVLRSPKGWTGPKVVDGKPIEGTWRAHQVPVADLQSKPAHVKILEDWMRSYRPEELFDENGKLISELAELAPKGERRMGANPHANGGILLRDLVMPDFRDYAVSVPKPGTENAEATRVLGGFLRDVMKLNAGSKNFRVFGPDETASNRLDALYEDYR